MSAGSGGLTWYGWTDWCDIAKNGRLCYHPLPPRYTFHNNFGKMAICSFRPTFSRPKRLPYIERMFCPREPDYLPVHMIEFSLAKWCLWTNTAICLANDGFRVWIRRAISWVRSSWPDDRLSCINVVSTTDYGQKVKHI